MRIWLQPERLAALGLTPADIETALRNQNVELPTGRLESADQNITLRVTRAFADVEQFRQLVVSRGGDGYLVRLGDVARVESGAENPYSHSGSTGIRRSAWASSVSQGQIPWPLRKAQKSWPIKSDPLSRGI